MMTSYYHTCTCFDPIINIVIKYHVLYIAERLRYIYIYIYRLCICVTKMSRIEVENFLASLRKSK